MPEITLFLWLIKMMSTTVGETAADFLNVNLNFGLTNTSVVTGILLVISLFFQIRARRYVPALYWMSVLLISVFGTLLTDNLTDNFNVPLAFSTVMFGALLIVTFSIWYKNEKPCRFMRLIQSDESYFTGQLFSSLSHWEPLRVTGWPKA